MKKKESEKKFSSLEDSDESFMSPKLTQSERFEAGQEFMDAEKNHEDSDESFMSPKLTESERFEAEQEFIEFRRSAEAKKTDGERLVSKLFQLKFQIEDYLKSDILDEQKNFGFFLKQYIEMIGKKNNEFADEIDINPTELSQIVNRHRDSSNKVIIRLEVHSNGIIPALSWFGIYSKDKARELVTNEQLLLEERKHVKKKLSLPI